MFSESIKKNHDRISNLYQEIVSNEIYIKKIEEQIQRNISYIIECRNILTKIMKRPVNQKLQRLIEKTWDSIEKTTTENERKAKDILNLKDLNEKYEKEKTSLELYNLNHMVSA